MAQNDGYAIAIDDLHVPAVEANTGGLVRGEIVAYLVAQVVDVIAQFRVFGLRLLELPLYPGHALGVTREALVEGTSSLEAFAFIRADHSRENHARVLTQQIVSLMLDEHLPGVCKDEMAQTIINAYWESRRRNHEENDTTTL